MMVTPKELTFIISVPLTSIESVLGVAADSPVLVLPAKWRSNWSSYSRQRERTR